MSTVAEIKQAVSKLPPRKKIELASWLRTQVDEGACGEVAMAVGARKLDLRAAARAKRMSTEETAEATRFLSDFDRAVKTIAAGPSPTGSIVATLARMRR